MSSEKSTDLSCCPKCLSTFFTERGYRSQSSKTTFCSSFCFAENLTRHEKARQKMQETTSQVTKSTDLGDHYKSFAICPICKNFNYRSDDSRAEINCSFHCAFHSPKETNEKSHDVVDKPSHYTSHKSGVECIDITQHMNFTLGNVIKYVWRADLKNGVEDLRKAKWYLEREIASRLVEESK